MGKDLPEETKDVEVKKHAKNISMKDKVTKGNAPTRGARRAIARQRKRDLESALTPETKEKLAQQKKDGLVQAVDIGANGTFKYALIKVITCKQQMVCVRGNSNSKLHSDIFAKFCKKEFDMADVMENKVKG